MRRIWFVAICFSFIAIPASAANIFVDSTLSSDCTSGGYSIASRDCSGSAGNGYNTISEAVSAMSAGDHIVIRGGTYQECVALSPSDNGSSWDEGYYNKIVSCGTGEGCSSNEWAVIDGNTSCTGWSNEVLGYASDNVSGSSSLKYWWFERLEIKNGGYTGESNGPGLWINGGPFKVRYCYIHDNGQTGSADYASTGTMGYGWRDSVIEFNWFADNGIPESSNNNCKNIAWDENYGLTNEIERYGVAINESTGVATSNGYSAITGMRNQIRYNLVEGGTVGIAPKHFIWRTGRDTGNSDYSDTYKSYGTEIDHNIVRNLSSYAIGAHGDFDQIHNNITDATGDGIRSMYDYWFDDAAYTFHYKVVAYNNTIINPNSNLGYIGLGRRWADWINDDIYAYIYNNICDGCGDSGSFSYDAGITPKVQHSSESRSLDYTNTVISNNYFYRPDDTSLYNIGYGDVYTNATFESQTDTHTPRESYSQAYDAENLLYQGATALRTRRRRPDGLCCSCSPTGRKARSTPRRSLRPRRFLRCFRPHPRVRPARRRWGLRSPRRDNRRN